MGSSHLSQENRSGMVGLMWSLLWLWGLWLAPLGSQAAAPESGLLEPQTTHISFSNPQVMREPNCCLLPALTPDPQCATDGTLPENLGESGRQGRSCGGHRRFKLFFLRSLESHRLENKGLSQSQVFKTPGISDEPTKS